MSGGIRQAREMGDGRGRWRQQCNTVTVSEEREWGRAVGGEVGERQREREECVPTWSVWSSGKLHSTVGSRGN